MAREKDQGAVLKLYLGSHINLEVDNTLPEDYVIGTEKISAKHSSGKIGTPIKVKWTASDSSVKDDIKAMIDAPDTYYPHLLITYVDVKSKKVSILCITADHNRHVIKTLREDAFHVPKGNSRGIEYSSKAMKLLLQNRYFTIEIENAELMGGLTPVERRIRLLQSMGIGRGG